MASIHGIQSTTPAYTPAKVQAPKGEFGETAQTERQEALSGAQEAGEAAASKTVGTKFSVTG